jgi:hypothetical protein
MLVSSQALTTASTIFSAILSFSGSSPNQNPLSPIEIHLPDDNPIVFTILMDILHDHCHKVYVEYPLRLLAYIAVAVDKYQLQAAVSRQSDEWIDELVYEVDLDEVVDVEELVLWLSVSWVFRDKKVFKKVTGRLVRIVRGVLDLAILEELPIPEHVLGWSPSPFSLPLFPHENEI